MARIVSLQFIFTILSLLLFSLPVASAQLVQVSDLTAQQFYSKMNPELQRQNNYQDNLHFDNLSNRLDIFQDSPYVAYMTVLPVGNQGSVVTLYANRANIVSKITINAPANTSNGQTAMALSCQTVMSLLGLTRDEGRVLIDTGRVWCAATQRRIILTFTQERNNILYARFTASDN